MGQTCHVEAHEFQALKQYIEMLIYKREWDGNRVSSGKIVLATIIGCNPFKEETQFEKCRPNIP